MAADASEQSLGEMRRLFGELDEVYARLSAFMQPFSYGNEALTQGRIAEERRKASDIIQRIRQIHRL